MFHLSFKKCVRVGEEKVQPCCVIIFTQQRRKDEFDLKEYYIDDDISGDSDERSHIKLHGNLESDKQKRDWKYKMRSKSDMRSTIGNLLLFFAVRLQSQPLIYVNLKCYDK